MKFIKKFDTLQDYNKYLFSENYINPNVSKINNNDNTLVKFDGDAAYLDVTINVTSTSSPTMIAYNNDNSIKEVIIDNDIIIRSPNSMPYTLSHQFETTGLHILKVKFKKTNGSYIIMPALAGNSNIIKISIPSIYTLANGALGGLSNLIELKLPSTLTVIPSGLIPGCQSIKSLEIPQSVTTIASGALNGSGIEELIIPDSVTNLGSNSLSNYIKKITFGKGLSEINSLGTYGLSSLTLT